MEIPDFEETVTEYDSQATTPASDVNDSMGNFEPVAAERKGGILGPSTYKSGFGREIEQAMGVKRADS